MREPRKPNTVQTATATTTIRKVTVKRPNHKLHFQRKIISSKSCKYDFVKKKNKNIQNRDFQVDCYGFDYAKNVCCVAGWSHFFLFRLRQISMRLVFKHYIDGRYQ